MHRKRGFTLIELMVVIALIAIMAAILFPVFARAREKARQAACLSNLKQIALAVRMYMDDYDDRFPFVLNFYGNCTGCGNYRDDSNYPVVPGATGNEPQFQLVAVVAPYVRSPSIWYCPSVGPGFVDKVPWWRKGATARDQGTTYAYNYHPQNREGSHATFMGCRSLSILLEPSRWPMVVDLPVAEVFTGNLADPPSSVVPHSGGVNVAYGDGHAKFWRLDLAKDEAPFIHHSGDGLYPGQ